MADAATTDTQHASGPGAGEAPDDVDGGLGGVARSTYDLLRARLDAAVADLAARAEALNQRRLEEFGSSVLTATATERVRTESAVVPRDVAAVADHLILAYNGAARVTGEVRPEDVFAVHHFSADAELTISPNADGLRGSVLDDDRFRADFDHLVTYYKSARLQQLYRVGDRLLAVFRTAAGSGDVTVMRWDVVPDGLRYVDNKGGRDHRFLPPSELEWTRATRAQNLDGEFFLVEDRVLVSPRRGRVRLMLDDGSADHQLLLTEPVEREQTLEDCDLASATAGHFVLLRLRPYAEPDHRYYVVNLLTHSAVRLDALGAAFRTLPNGQGLIFPQGVYLATGELRTFDVDPAGMELQEIVSSPNGEDVLYVFHEVEGGRSILLPYNLVRQEVMTPIWCHGHCLFDDGRMVVFREEAEPSKVHTIQVWDTPFCSPEVHAERPRARGPLAPIGNAGLVAGIGDALALRRMVRDVTPSVDTYAEIMAQAGRVLDAHQHWYASPDVGDLATPVRAVRTAAEEVIGQFEQLQEVRAAASADLAAATDELTELLDRQRLEPPSTAAEFIAALAGLRMTLGRLLLLRDRREIDVEALAEVIGRAEDRLSELAVAAAEHLATDGAFDHYDRRFAELDRELDQVTTALAARELLAEVDEVAADLDLVTSTVGDLEIDDLTVRTAVLEQVSAVAAGLNRVRARIDGRLRTLVESEYGAAFTTELGLVGQSLSTLLARADSPEACDEVLGRLLGQLEALETSAPRTDQQLEELAARRTQVEETVGAQRQRLVDERQRRADQLGSAAARNVAQLARRAAEMGSVDEIVGFFAADPAAQRARSLVDQLRELGEAVRADEMQSALGKAQDDAVRALRDRQELFDGDLVRLGEHGFSIETRTRNLTVTPVGDRLEAVLTGTDLRLDVDDPDLEAHRDRWHDPLPSETPELYRSVFLAAELLLNRRPEVAQALATTGSDRLGADGPVLALVQSEVAQRLDEGYDRGVHDHDAALIVAALAAAVGSAEDLPVAGGARAEAVMAWFGAEESARVRWAARGAAVGRLGSVDDERWRELVAALGADLDLGPVAARYLLGEIRRSSDGQPVFGAEPEMLRLRTELSNRPAVAEARKLLTGGSDGGPAADRLGDGGRGRPTDDGDGRRVDVDGLVAVLTGQVVEGAGAAGAAHLVPELIASLVWEEAVYREVPPVAPIQVTGLTGRHPTLVDGRFTGRVDEILARAAAHRADVVPSHQAFSSARRRVSAELVDRLRLDDLEPKVPEGFVRNGLISNVYLPLIGQNLARQIGTATDVTGQRSGLLMLLSPPGYGKTTLVDYVADRLGMALVKVSGPSLGHDVTSLDPAQAPNAAARREVERINLSFAVGTNVILYIDDIQHTDPELLQRFISLCDAQRRIEGVWNGRPTTFDLRGKRFAVIMAGNPYTESGERFRIPDMLANRADTWNLGDVVGSNDELFARSYLENALTANQVTAPLAGRDRDDLARLLRAADGEPLDASELGHAYSTAEVADLVAVLGHLRTLQRTVLAVNRRYIASAATDNAYRTEPPFLLQGSYRNMARLAARILPAMTSAEVEAVIDDHYLAEAQALTGDAEANLLRLADLRGVMTDEQRTRWDEIVEAFRRRQRLGGTDDPTIVAAELVASSIDRLARG